LVCRAVVHEGRVYQQFIDLYNRIRLSQEDV
jgi:hypothetical protein